MQNYLNPSHIAHHNYLKGVGRTPCTPGTRVSILQGIETWAKNTSSASPPVCWLFGPAGSGKSTIAYTIAQRFHQLSEPEPATVLGGDFFCSRQFEETRSAKRIVPTIVYHIALRCETFAAALNRSGTLGTVYHNVHAQLEGLLVGPWQAAEAARPSAQSYLIVIDALDEIGGGDGLDFLRDLLDVVNKHRLRGLKFFATSRPEPGLVAHIESFEDKRFYRLEHLPIEDAKADIAMYLNASLPYLAGHPEIDQLALLADGLFIYAATVVKYLQTNPPAEQERLLNNFLSASRDTSLNVMDGLYLQILRDAFADLEVDLLRHQLHILHTFLCTAERTSASTVTALLACENSVDSFASGTNSAFSNGAIADDVVKRLYAVLYIEGGKVFWFHKSFPDFIFMRARSNEFWCDELACHQHLMHSCFHIMREELRFNIADIPSSFVLDKDSSDLPDKVKQNISPVLSYSCRNWSHHLSNTMPTISDSDLHGTLSDFLELRALFWIEAMNLLESSGLCDPMLRTAQEWVADNNAVLAEQFSEVTSFAVYFSGSPASKSTPHLYISALATWPRNRDPCRGWKRYFPGIPRFINALGRATVLMTLRVGSEVNTIAYSTDGRWIITGSVDKLVKVWDASKVEVVRVLIGHTGPVMSVAVSRDGRRILSGSRDRSLRIWDASTGKLLHALPHTDSVVSIALSEDETHVVFARPLCVWSEVSMDQTLSGTAGLVTSVACSGKHNRIVSGSEDGLVCVWDVSPTGKMLRVKEHTYDLDVNSVALSEDGQHIVFGSDDGSVCVWEVESDRLIKMFNEGHKGPVMSVAISSDGKRIVSGSQDNSVRVWDVSTGKQLSVLNGHDGWVTSVAFSSDGRRIFSGSHDKTVRVWETLMDEVSGSLDESAEMMPRGLRWQPSMDYIRQKTTDSTGQRCYTGWLLACQDRKSYLIFVPLDAISPCSSRILTIPGTSEPAVHLDANALGNNWHNCYRS